MIRSRHTFFMRYKCTYTKQCLYDSTKSGILGVVSILVCMSDQKSINHALSIAARTNPDTRILDILIQAGASELGRALVIGSELGHYHIVRLLLDHGTDVNSENGESARLAAAAGHLNIVKLLIERGGNLHLNLCGPGGTGGGVLEFATFGDQVETVKFLVAYGSDVNHLYAMALWLAVSHKNLSIIRVLLAAGADPNLKDTTRNQKSALDTALEIDDHLIIRLLQAYSGS